MASGGSSGADELWFAIGVLAALPVRVEFPLVLLSPLEGDVGKDPVEPVRQQAPQMVAAAASAALRALVDYYAESDAAHDPEQLLDQAARFLDAGLASLSES
jgi:hypothetical protein